jgi:hypothetical protein
MTGSLQGPSRISIPCRRPDRHAVAPYTVGEISPTGGPLDFIARRQHETRHNRKFSKSSDTASIVAQSQITVSNARLTATLAAKSVTTLVGKP